MRATRTMNFKLNSYWIRRIQRHLALALVSGAFMTLIFYVLTSPDAAFKLSMASAYVGLGLLVFSLIIGPWRVLRNCPNPVSSDLRRDIGIWAGLVGIAHMIIGLQVHLGGKFWLYFIYPPKQSHLLHIRHDLFGFANFTGLISALVLLLLLALSNDLSLRTLGTERWKSLQRWNYAAFALIFFHGVAYQLVEKRDLPFVGLFGVMVLLVVIMQIAGFRKIRLLEK